MSSASPLQKAVADILGPQGLLDEAWDEYEPRPGQLQMALEAARAFESQDAAVVEAGTGTGKTLAYLIPALLSGLKTIVSTGTKNLQEQIFHKDIPFIRARLGADFEAAYLKGRENYLCLHFLNIFLQEPTFEILAEADFLDDLVRWSRETRTGDRAELTDFPENFLTWSELSAAGDRCLGRKCPEFSDCFLWKARRAAARADLVVVNHHLFMADLAVRGKGPGEVIPEYEAVVFDEAHQLEDVATQHFGAAVSTWRLAGLKRDVEKKLLAERIMTPTLGRILIALGHQADVLARDHLPEADETELWGEDAPELDRLRDFSRQILAGLDNLAGRLEALSADHEDLEGLAQRAFRTAQELAFILEASDRNHVYWAERRGRGLFLRASPIRVDEYLRESLYAQGKPLVFTSATLTAQGSFEYFKDRMGIFPEIEGVEVPSPFDFENRSLLYVPRNFPDPRDGSFLAALVTEIDRLLHASQGRAFVLFTSYRNLNHAAEKLAGKLPWPCLIQGQAPRTALLDRFRRQTNSVLMATHSFWQGVDVPGESLSAVIIDKLPFPRPDRPLVRARSQLMRREGRDPFMNYHLPEAIIALKQGLGRLIRSQSDRGLMAVLDSRLVNKGYGKKFLKSLPVVKTTGRFEDAAAFFDPGADRTEDAPGLRAGSGKKNCAPEAL